MKDYPKYLSRGLYLSIYLEQYDNDREPDEPVEIFHQESADPTGNVCSRGEDTLPPGVAAAIT